MGSLDKQSNHVVREIEIVDLTGKSIAQIESAFNDNYGKKGWRIVQILTLGGTNYLVAEREV